jgi:hypothetical protein
MATKSHVGNVGGAARNWWSLKTPELGTFNGRTFNEVIKKFDNAMQAKYPGETIDAFYLKHRRGGNIRRASSHKKRTSDESSTRRRSIG